MRVPVLIPVYNGSATLVETLASLAAQHQSSVDLLSRVIIADDASTDGTAELALATWVSSTAPLEVWRSAVNGGERRTVNQAFARLRAEGVQKCLVLHADDVAKPHWMETLLTVAEAFPEAASICSSWDSWHADGSTVPGEDDLAREPEVIRGNDESASSTLKRGCWWHFSGCLMNLEAFEQVGGFDENMPQLGDIEWLVRCLRKRLEVIYVPRTLIRYRCHSGSVSGVSFRTNRDLRESWRIIQRFGDLADLRAGINAMASSRCRQAFRRGVVALAKGRVAVAFEALKLAALFAFRWVK